MKKVNLLISLMIFTITAVAMARDPKIKVTKPEKGITWCKGEKYTIRWWTVGNMDANVKIRLFQGNTQILRIIDSTKNSSGYNTYNWIVPWNISSGDYVIRVKTVDNLYEDDSDVFKIASCSISKPDLIAERDKITITPRVCKAGDTVTLRAIIENMGQNRADPSVAKLTITGPDDFQTIIKSFTVPALGHLPGYGITNYSIEYSHKPPKWGSYKYTVTADANHEVSEVNENNNEGYRYNSVGPRPDLTVFVPSKLTTVSPGYKRDIRATVKNIGGKKSPPCTLRFFVEQNKPETCTVPELDPGEVFEKKRRENWSTKGNKKYYAHVDWGNQVEESNEENNYCEGHVLVSLPMVEFDRTGLGTAGSDELVIQFSFPHKIKVNTNATIKLQVKNTGFDKSAKCDLHVTITDRREKTYPLPVLLPGEKHNIIRLISWRNPGTKTISAWIDPNNKFNRMIVVEE